MQVKDLKNLETLKGLWVIRQKDSVLYVTALETEERMALVSNDRPLWIVWPDSLHVTQALGEITQGESVEVDEIPGYVALLYESVPLDTVAELDYDLTTDGVFTTTVVGPGQGNGPLKAFLKSTLTSLKASRKRCDKDLDAVAKTLKAELKDIAKDYATDVKNAKANSAAQAKEAIEAAKLDDKLIKAVQRLQAGKSAPKPKKKVKANRKPTGKRKAKKRGRK